MSGLFAHFLLESPLKSHKKNYYILSLLHRQIHVKNNLSTEQFNCHSWPDRFGQIRIGS